MGGTGGEGMTQQQGVLGFALPHNPADRKQLMDTVVLPLQTECSQSHSL